MEINQIKQKALDIRKSVLNSIHLAESGHTGGSLGLVDIFSLLYFKVLNHDPLKPSWENRDRLILSIGHVAPVLYSSLAHAGYFPLEELSSLRKLGTRLQGHPGRDHGLPGIELSAGSLGQGLSVAVGMALAANHKKQDWNTFCILGDGELQEGSIWEAAMSAGHYRLDNLTAIVDRNWVQIDGKTEDVMKLEPLAEKWKSFNWEVFECNGNNIENLVMTFEKIMRSKGKPKVLIAETKMGAGIPSIEGNNAWHGKAPNKVEFEQFMEELNHE